MLLQVNTVDRRVLCLLHPSTPVVVKHMPPRDMRSLHKVHLDIPHKHKEGTLRAMAMLPKDRKAMADLVEVP